MVTSFTRFIVALSFLRSGLGLQSAPANLVLISLSLFMTFFVIAPTFDRAWQNGLKPLMDNQISQPDALAAVVEPFREFMLGQVREKDMALFEGLSKGRFEVTDRSKADLRLLIPAFMISELRRGFEIGFLIVLPFLVIDMIVATLTMSMGMMMLPPSVISLPVKILFFVLIDGWNLLDRKSGAFGELTRAPRAQSGASLAQGRAPQMARIRRGRFMSILNTSVSGMQGNSNWLSTISQNVANANTTGYKNVETDFSSLVDQIANGEADFGGVSTIRSLSTRSRGVSSPPRPRPTSPFRAPGFLSCPTPAARHI